MIIRLEDAEFEVTEEEHHTAFAALYDNKPITLQGHHGYILRVIKDHTARPEKQTYRVTLRHTGPQTCSCLRRLSVDDLSVDDIPPVPPETIEGEGKPISLNVAFFKTDHIDPMMHVQVGQAFRIETEHRLVYLRVERIEEK